MNKYCILKNGEWLIDPLKINADRNDNSLWTKTPHGVLIFDDKNQGEIYLAQNIDVLGNEAKVTLFLIRNFNTETLISGNIISNCGKAAIKTEGVDDLTISKNKISNTNKGVEVTLKGLFANPSIVDNEIYDIKEEGIHIMQDPYLALDIPKRN
ncbi:right-handed parallel beta-helix repeat-containing protein [Acinetobacter pittii]|nr:right-handed parallel beta-helix repeat-containing protein [Acinetobacter pittii]